MASRLDPVVVLNAVATYGHVSTASQKLGMHPNSLRAIASRPGNWRLKFAIESGLYIYRHDRGKKHTGRTVFSYAAIQRCSSRIGTKE